MRLFLKISMIYLSLMIIIHAHFSFNTQAQETIPIPTPAPEKTAEEEAPQIPQNPPDDFVYRSACPALLDKRIKAEMIEPIDDDGCGEGSPLKVSAIVSPSINLSGDPILNCRMAERVVEWADKINEKAKELLGSPIKQLVTGNGYQCRRRNNLPTGKISEHGFANALDLIGLELADNRILNIEDHWDIGEEPSAESLFLQEVHGEACKLFTTVLGPEANASHKDHFHLDLGCHGKDCTYLLCE